LQLGETVGDSAYGSQANHNHDGVANLLLDLRFWGSLDIHSAYFKKFLESCNSLVERAAMRARRMIWIELGTNFTRNYTVLRHGTTQSLCQQATHARNER